MKLVDVHAFSEEEIVEPAWYLRQNRWDQNSLMTNAIPGLGDSFHSQIIMDDLSIVSSSGLETSQSSKLGH